MAMSRKRIREAREERWSDAVCLSTAGSEHATRGPESYRYRDVEPGAKQGGDGRPGRRARPQAMIGTTGTSGGGLRATWWAAGHHDAPNRARTLMTV